MKKENKENKKFIISDILPDGRMVEMIYKEEINITQLITFDGEQIEYNNEIYLPDVLLAPYSAKNSLISKKVIKLPSEATEYGTEKELLGKIQKFIHKYLDINLVFEKIASYYVLFTWCFDRFNELPYLRAIGDWGSGKSRFLQVVGSICYKPIFAGGATTTSPLFRIIDEARGTVILDEADYRFSDTTTDIIKILNCGYQKGIPVLRSEGTGKGKFDVKSYDVFCPKIIATRKQFNDQALESRFLVEEMEKKDLREDIPINLPDSFENEALELRNQLLMWRFRNFHKVGLKTDAIDRSIEPRLNQITIPLLSIIDDDQTRDEIKKSVQEYNKELFTDRGMSLEAEVLIALFTKYEAGYPDPTMKDVSDTHAAQNELNDKEKLKPRRVGNLIRKQLKLIVVRKGIGFVVPEMENKQKLIRLKQKYSIPGQEKPDTMNEMNVVNVQQASNTTNKIIIDDLF